MAEKTEFKAPSVGDEVNFVQPGTLASSKVKVTAVNPKHDGRVVTLANEKTVPYREKSKPAGNTWHYAAAILLALFVGILAENFARAVLPTYHTATVTAGFSNVPANGFFAADPNSQVRVIQTYWAGTNSGTLNFQSGTTAYSLVSTNISNVTNIVNSTNGLATGAIYLQHIGTVYSNGVVSWGTTGTNTFGYTGGPLITNLVASIGANGTGPAGVAATNLSFVVLAANWTTNFVGDPLYLGGTVQTIYLNIIGLTNYLVGDDIFSGNYGRPVYMWMGLLAGTNGTGALTVSSHYDSQSQ